MKTSLSNKVIAAFAGLATAFSVSCGPHKRPRAPITDQPTTDTPRPQEPRQDVPRPDGQGQDVPTNYEVLPRSFNDRQDDLAGSQIHVIYAIPGDGIDGRLDQDGRINQSLYQVQRWLSQRTGKEVRFDTYQGSPDVSFLRLRRTEQDIIKIAGGITTMFEEEVAAAGFGGDDKKFLLYYDGKSNYACGAAWSPGKVAGVHLQGSEDKPCPRDTIGLGGFTDLSALHEFVHALGFVDKKAPNYVGRSGGAHVPEPTDLMYCGCGGNWDPQEVDVGRDDYFGHGREDLPDLARSPFLRAARQGNE